MYTIVQHLFSHVGPLRFKSSSAWRHQSAEGVNSLHSCFCTPHHLSGECVPSGKSQKSDDLKRLPREKCPPREVHSTRESKKCPVKTC